MALVRKIGLGFFVILLIMSPAILVHGTTPWTLQTVDRMAISGGVSVVVDSHDNPHLCYIDSQNGSFYVPNTNYQFSREYLMYTSWNGTSWDAAVVDSWRIQSGRVPGEVGFCSLALDAHDNPHIIYGVVSDNETYYSLKYAYWSGSNWAIQTVDFGNQASIVLDSAGNPSIAYSGLKNELKYANWTGSSWNIQTLDSDVVSSAFKNPVLYLALDVNGSPFIIYGHDYPYGNLTVKSAAWTPFGWKIQTVLSNSSFFDFGNVALDSRGFPHFTYSSYFQGELPRLIYDSWNGSSWNEQVVESVYDLFTGSFLRFDSNDAPCITYANVSPNDSASGLVLLKYTKLAGISWVTEVIDASFGNDDARLMPFALDSAGNPHICYLLPRQSSTLLDAKVMYATSNQPTPTPSPAVPELSYWIALPLLMTATGLIAAKMKLKRVQK